jgi:uncharacterized sulfatase
MRSGGEGVEKSDKPDIPPFVKCFSEYLRNNGYYCTNNSKQDYNFVPSDSAWDESSNQAHWRNRPNKETPFFAVFNYTGTHEGSVRMSEEQYEERTRRLTPNQRQNPEQLKLPPYYPDTPKVRKYWARYYELVTAMDYWISDHLDQLEKAGLEQDTIVFFWSDHGVGMPRAKRWVYDSGTHVPLIIRIPKIYRRNAQGTPGSVDDRLISSVDFAPTLLNLVDIEKPAYMQGQPFLGKNIPPERKYVFGTRDRMDDRYDIIRTVRDKKYRYIRNYQPYKPYFQYIQTAEKGPVMQEIRDSDQQSKVMKKYLAREKPVEELYDISKDPYELNNVADDPEYKSILNRMWTVHKKWMIATHDLGLIPESELKVLEKEYGNRYAILRQPDQKKNLLTLHAVAAIAGKPKRQDQFLLLNAIKHNNPWVRYWAAIGIGNLKSRTKPFIKLLRLALNDIVPSVRIAAARALCEMGLVEQALDVLIKQVQNENEWVRLDAVTVLDELGELARPAIPVLKQALQDKENKYVVRVANHALNELLNKQNRVR